MTDSNGRKLKKWTDVYPQGTQEGNEELKFFTALARNPNYSWRSVESLVKESGLSVKRVEEIIKKYHKKGMIIQNKDNWGYWERNKDALNKKESVSPAAVKLTKDSSPKTNP